MMESTHNTRNTQPHRRNSDLLAVQLYRQVHFCFSNHRVFLSAENASLSVLLGEARHDEPVRVESCQGDELFFASGQFGEKKVQ